MEQAFQAEARLLGLAMEQGSTQALLGRSAPDLADRLTIPRWAWDSARLSEPGLRQAQPQSPFRRPRR